MEGGAYVSFEGILDISRHNEVTDRLSGWSLAPSVVINLTRVEHVDSLILGVLVSCRRIYIEAGGDSHNFILVVARNGGLRRIFAETGLDRLFSIAYTGERGSVGKTLADELV